MKTLTQPLKWHGGKSYLADKIIGLMPPRVKNPNAPAADDPGWVHYVEPYFGGGAVLLAQDPEGISEVVCDKNSDVTLFWRVLQLPEQFNAFERQMQSMPFSEFEYRGSKARLKAPFMESTRRACEFFVSCRQSLAGRMDSFAPLSRTRTRRGMNEQASAWMNTVNGLRDVHERLSRVVILHGEALDVIRQQDGERTLFYLDPPYLHETRATTGEYQFEMTDVEHRALLETIAAIRGRFLLSGYSSRLYEEFEEKHGWNRATFAIPNNAASGKVKRTMAECVWMNY